MSAAEFPRDDDQLDYVLYAITEGATSLASEGISEDDRQDCPEDLYYAIIEAEDVLHNLEQLLQSYRAKVEAWRAAAAPTGGEE